MASARPAAAGASEHSIQIQMPAVTAAAVSGDDGSGTQRSAPEETLNLFVRSVAFLEWVGNGFGLLSFTWATVVLLNGYTSLNDDDLWSTTVIMFIETVRIFSRGYTMDSHSLFGTTKAITWTSSSFARRLASPQGNEVVVIMGLWNKLFYELRTIIYEFADPGLITEVLVVVFNVVGLIILSKLVLRDHKMEKGPRQGLQLLLWAVLIAFLPIAAYKASLVETHFHLAADIATMVTMIVAVLLLSVRPRCIGSRITSPCGRRLVSLAKLISGLWLAAYCFVRLAHQLGYYNLINDRWYLFKLSMSFTTVVLSLGSLQEQTIPATSRPTDSVVDVLMHIFFLWNMALSIPNLIFVYWRNISEALPLPIGPSMIYLSTLLFGNQQIPATAVQILVSFQQNLKLTVYADSNYYYPADHHGRERNLVNAIAIFYSLALCQGAIYTTACIIGLFSFFPRRLLVRRLKLSGQRGVKAIDLYYHYAYATRMKIGVHSKGGNRISLASFAMDSLCSDSSESQLQLYSGSSELQLQFSGLLVLDGLLHQESQSRDMLISRITSSDKEVSILIAMLSWTAEQHREIRLFAARVTTMMAPSLRVVRFPGMVSMVSSLLDAGNDNQPPAEQDPGSGTPVQHDSCPELGLIILEKLAHDYENCAEIFKATNLISKIIGLMTFNSEAGEPQRHAVIRSSLDFVRRLAITGDEIGVNIRQELQKNPFLLNNLAGILDDPRSSPRLWTPAMDIIAKLLLHKRAAKEIGRMTEIIGKLMHSFLGRYGPANMDDDDQLLPMVAGDALANLTIWGTQNCSAILEEPGYQVIEDLNNMLREDDYRCAAATVLQNLCAHCGVKLMSHPDANNHLSSTLTTVMEHIMAAEGKQLESLVGLATQIGDVILEPFVHQVESQVNTGAELVQKLVCTLNSSKIPNPEHPRMRRVIVKIMITILRSCHHTVEKLMEEGMMERLMEALTKIDRTPSKVENYRVFYGNKGVLLENEEPMTKLLARAKEALFHRATQTAGIPGNGR